MAFCQSAGVPCLDLTSLFQSAMRHGILPYADVDSHWSPDGHQLVAEHLADDLRKRGWLTAAAQSR
jgi:SGNH hydrolase-like domain, acetyltransferase AlgX